MSDEGKLFIGGLSFETNEESLAEAFGKYGTIEKVDVIRDKETGRSRGFGFVKYESVEDAKDAMTAMNGKSLDGRAIRVDEAGKGLRPRGGFQSSSRSRGRSGRGSYGGDRSYGDRSYGERSYGNNDRGFGGSGGYRSGGYSGGYRDNRMQGGYERSGSYRDGYDGYATHELNGPKPGLDRRPEQAAVRGRLTSTDEGIRSHVLQMFPTRILLTERFGGSACRRRGSAWQI